MQKDLKKKIVKVLLVGALAIVPLFPFKVFADTTLPITYNSQSIQNEWSSHLHVTNYCESPLQGSTPCKLTFTLDDNYYGMISFDGYAGTSLALNYVTVFVSGGIGEYNYRTFSNANPMYINSINIMGVGLVIPDSNVDLTLIEQLLTSINNYESLNNNLLDILTDMRQWNIPFESWNYVLNTFMLGYEDYELSNVNYFQMPLFHLNDNNLRLLDRYNYFKNQNAPENEKTFVLYIDCNVWNRTQWFTFFEVRDSNGNVLTEGTDYSLNDFTIIQQRIMPSSVNFFTVGNIIKFDIQNISSSDKVMDLYFKYNVNNVRYYMPIYSNVSSNRNISTDFALIFGLSNDLLDNLGIIAQGTQQSNQSGDDLENSAADITTNSNTMFQFENQQNTNMNNALQSINTNFDIGTIGSSFLTSAAWVKTQFDNLTNTTPFGSVLSFSLLLGLALLIIGKVYK